MFPGFMDEAFIVVSVVSGLFTLAGIMLLNHNWFKKERFKLEVFSAKKEFDMKLKKMARDMGLDTKPGGVSQGQGGGLGGNIGGLLDLAKNLNISKEQIGDILDIVAGGGGGGAEEEPEGGSALGDTIGDLLQTDTGQAIVKGLSQGLLKGGTQQNQDNAAQV